MEEQDLKFFKIAIASILGLLVLLLITSITIAVYSTDAKNSPVYQQPSTAPNTNYAPAPTEWSNLDSGRYAPEEQKNSGNCGAYPCSYPDMNSPPCADPCKVRVEYTNKYFLPYPKYTYDRYYYEPYYDYPIYRQPHYPLNQRFFHHRIVQSDYTY